MRPMLRCLARAWMFVLQHLPNNKEALLATKDLRPRVHMQMGELRSMWDNQADLGVKLKIWDVEGMYPSMPKPLVGRARREIL